MEASALLSKIKKAFPDAVLDHGKFGRSGDLAIWVSVKELADLGSFLKSEPELSLDWLENLSAMQMDDALVLTYFLRSYLLEHSLLLRVSLEISGKNPTPELDSVASVWEMAASFESEIQELFGIVFTTLGRRKYPHQTDWGGFPLRKDFVLPKEPQNGVSS